MHEQLFGRQDQWSGKETAVTVFKQIAGDLKLDQAKFDACLDGGSQAALVNADQQEGMAAGVSGTPAFRINGAELSGARPYSDFQQQLDFYLAGGEPPSLEVAADSFRSMGSADAKVVITEFSDFQ